MRALRDLLELPQKEQEALGVTATAREIAQQPATWRGTRAIFEEQAKQLRIFLEGAGVRGPVEQRPTLVLTGAGTSDYVGQVLTLLLRSSWGLETQAIPSTDLLADMPDHFVRGRRTLMISFSRSGDSPEGVTVLAQALENYPSITHLVVTCNEHGRMARMVRDRPNAYAVVLDDVVNDRGLAMTSSFTNMVILGQCLAHAWTLPAYDAIFGAIVQAGEQFMQTAELAARDLATGPHKRICVLGSCALTGVARESALKVLEMTAGGIKTMAESFLGLRHGPMAALDRETLLVCFASGDRRRQRYEADLLREIGAKGLVTERVVVGPSGATALRECSDLYLPIEGDVPDLYRPPVDVMLGQLMGLHASLAHGLKPDSPSPNAVISRVVRRFQIYEQAE